MGALDWITSLFSSPQATAPAKSALSPAPALTQYPSPDDAEYARKYEFGYGRGLEPYVNNDVARVLGRYSPSSFADKKDQLTFTPTSAGSFGPADVANLKNSANLDLTKTENALTRGHMQNFYARAALAANRVPIAALGFDPGRTTADPLSFKTYYGGFYFPDTDTIYANKGIPSASPSPIVHESIHRGIEKLRSDPEAKSILDNLPAGSDPHTYPEEYLVRHLMTTMAGNPERDTGSVGQKQREMAAQLYGDGRNTSQIERLNRIAQDMIAARRPRGPN